MDENLPHKLRHMMFGYDVRTVDYMGWGGVKNGELLARCESGGFDVLLTADQSLCYQQNMGDRRIALIVLNTNDLYVLQTFSDRIIAAIERAAPGSLQFVQ